MKKLLINLVIFILIFIFISPIKVQAANTIRSDGTLDDILGGADNFVGGITSTGNTTPQVNEKLKSTSDFLYNTLLAIGMVVAVIVGLILGIKYMTAGSEDKANIKETIPAFIVSCVVIFGAFTIWKIIINMIQ